MKVRRREWGVLARHFGLTQQRGGDAPRGPGGPPHFRNGRSDDFREQASPKSTACSTDLC